MRMGELAMNSMVIHVHAKLCDTSMDTNWQAAKGRYNETGCGRAYLKRRDGWTARSGL